ncbi:hypothetical protein [Halobacillus sp. A5]|uniref:hypothetical protein n=1 Tax=Halobacillus sp. A5 TaxID=2880263 RepID=UPI0020A61F5B|nr:hypothetical protein [Halobacillus sp. A5]
MTRTAIINSKNILTEQCRGQKIRRLAIQFSEIIDINNEWAVLLKNLVVNLQLLGIEVVLAGLVYAKWN